MLTGGLALLLGQPAAELQPVQLALAAPAGAATKGFQPDQLSAPGNYPFTIEFSNDDVTGGVGVQHNVVVTQEKTVDPTGAIAVGTPITGPNQVAVPVSGLAQGSYYFFCEFHPTTMTGKLTVAGPPPAPGAPAGPVITAADATAFSPNTIELPSGQPATITFDNEDPGATHNLDVFSDKDYTTEISKTPDVVGIGSGEVSLPALDPGTYYFRCDFHPTTMQGTITVAKSGGGSSPSGTASGASTGPSG
jgi:plastocyanin